MRIEISNPEQLENTVQVLCKIVEKKQYLHYDTSEYSLRRELVACILSSQVKYEMAKAALSRIEGAGLLTDKWWCDNNNQFESRIVEELSGSNLGAYRSYRFPRSRASQLAKARDAIVARTLTERVYCGNKPLIIRRHLIADIAGMGPKQASMFLRNSGISYDLAILDTHVLHYLYIKKILSLEQLKVSTLSTYEKVESIVIQYAESLGCLVGHLDLAIWATMRAAKELNI